MSKLRFPRQSVHAIHDAHGPSSFFFFHSRRGNREFWDYALLRFIYDGVIYDEGLFPIEVFSSITGVLIPNFFLPVPPSYPMFEYVAPERVGPGLIIGPRDCGAKSSRFSKIKPDPRLL